MSDDYTRWDSIKQTQAYLLEEAPRIARIFRWTNEPTKEMIRTTMLASVESPAIAPCTALSKSRLAFLDLPDAFTNSLNPKIKVYKTYIDEDGTEHDYLLPMGEYLGRRANGDGTLVETTRGVVVKSVEFTRLGGNPAEVDTNIKFNLKLFAQDITTFFVKNETAPLVPYTPQASEEFIFQSGRYEEIAARNTEMDREYQAAVASGTVPPIGRGSAIRRQGLFDQEERVWNTVEQLALSEGTVGPNGERRAAWIDLIKIDPSQPLNDGENDSALVTSETQVRIKVEIGYATPDTKPINYNKDDWEDWAEVIGNQKEVFYLSLFKHQFEFRGYDGVDLSIDFIASGNAVQLSPEADLFKNAKTQNKLTRLRASMRAKEKEIKLAQEQEQATSITEVCVENLQIQIGDIEEQIREINSKNKLRLLNQIYLQGVVPRGAGEKPIHGTRLFLRAFKGPSPDSKIKNRQYNPEYRFPNNIDAGAVDLSVSDEASMMSLSVIDEDWATRDDEADVATTEFSYDDTKQEVNHFIFLGDVIDAALELLVSTETLNITTTFTTDALIGFERQHEYDRQFHPPIDFGARADRIARINSIISEFGGFIGGWVTYKNPNNITEENNVAIRDIPIALDIFRSWWLNNYVKSSRNTLSLKDFIVQFMRFVETEVFGDIPVEHGMNEDKLETPRFIVQSFVARGGFLQGVYRNALANGANAGKKRVSESLLLSAGLGTSTEGKNVLIIEQSDTNPMWNDEIATITFGETSKGVLKGVNFEREDIPGHAEARLFSDRTSVAGNIALREKYNTKLDLIGTTSLLPGSLFYLDPLPLDLGYSKTEKKSFARQLGLGGMYRVVNLTSAISFDAAASRWETTVNTKWESFGDGDDGVTEVEKVETSNGLCADQEASAAEARARNAEFEEAQFDGNY